MYKDGKVGIESMSRNVLSELDILTNEVVDVGYRDFSGEKRPYSSVVQRVFSKLLGYVRGGSWTDNDTAKFVAQNFHVGQSNLSEAWSRMYPSKQPKADATMRTQYQKINKYLSNVLPVNLVDIFINEDSDGLLELSSLIDALYLNDDRIESKLGEQLISELQSLPLTSKKYSVSECMDEVGIIKKLSMFNCKELLSKCDIGKLAYTYFVLTRPSVLKGELNKPRLDFIKAFSSLDVPDVQVESVTDVRNMDMISEDVDSNCFSTLGFVSDYVKDVEVPEDTIVNPEVIKYLHSVTTQSGIMKGLSKFKKEDVAYVLQDETYMEMISTGLPEKDSSLVGEYKFLPNVREDVETYIEGVSPSDEVSVYAVQLMNDYLTSTFEKRLKSLSREEVARVYEDMVCGDENNTVKLLDLLGGIDYAQYERLKGKIVYELTNN